MNPCHLQKVVEKALHNFPMLPRSYHSSFDNLVSYTCINVQVNEQTRKIRCIINISKINNVQTNVQNLSVYVMGLRRKMMCTPALFVAEVKSPYSCGIEQASTVHS